MNWCTGNSDLQIGHLLRVSKEPSGLSTVGLQIWGLLNGGNCIADLSVTSN